MLIRRLTLAPVNVHISRTLFRHLAVTDSRFLAKLLAMACATGLSSLLVLSLWREAYRRLKRDLVNCSPVIGSFSMRGIWQLERRNHE